MREKRMFSLKVLIGSLKAPNAKLVGIVGILQADWNNTTLNWFHDGDDQEREILIIYQQLSAAAKNCETNSVWEHTLKSHLVEKLVKLVTGSIFISCPLPPMIGIWLGRDRSRAQASQVAPNYRGCHRSFDRSTMLCYNAVLVLLCYIPLVWRCGKMLHNYFKPSRLSSELWS